MRLIDADAMRDGWLENGENEYIYDTNAMLDSIDAQPTIDAVPVVHGRWEKSEHLYGYVVCSVCHDCYVWGEWIDKKKWGHCPNCGAKMDGDADV